MTPPRGSGTKPPRGSRAAPAVVIGTRPEAIKLAPVVRALTAAGAAPRVVSTGQHRELLDPILDELGLEPDARLEVMEDDQSLAGLSARILEGIDRLLVRDPVRRVVVQGDTTTAAMAALAAHYRGVAVAHVEAGLRTGNPRNPFPEETNRRLVACLADLHFAPTPRARDNLLAEGVPAARIHVVGNTVIDALVDARDRLLPARPVPAAMARLLAGSPPLVLATVHRRESFGRDLAAICDGLERLAGAAPGDLRIVFPVHRNPNVEGEVRRRLGGLPNVVLTEPLPYLAFVRLLLAARLVVTDSGGLQEEAAFLGIPTLVVRRASERREAIEAGVAELVGCEAEPLAASARRLLTDAAHYRSRARPTTVFGDGGAARRIAEALVASGC